MAKVKSLVVCAIERMEVNDATIIAVLAAYPQMHNIPRFSATVPIVSHFFVLGLICSLVAGGFVCFYQSAITFICWNNMMEEFPKENEGTTNPRASLFCKVLGIHMLGFGTASTALFSISCCKLLKAFS